METQQIEPHDFFDLEDEGVQVNPYPFYPILRENTPVLKSVFRGQPCWVVSRREDVTAILFDWKTYSCRTAPLPMMLFEDPPEHHRLRAMVASLFTQAAVRTYAGAIEAEARSLLESCLAQERCDLVLDYASPLTIAMIGRVLGISTEEVEQIRQWSLSFVEYTTALRVGKSPDAEAAQAIEDMSSFIMAIVDRRRFTDDGVMAVLAERYHKSELTADELINFAILLLVAGHSTTTNLIGNATFILSSRPEYLAKMRGDRNFVSKFIEEALRTRPSFHRLTRITTRDVELHGEHIPAGSIVRLLLASANRDPMFFPDAEEFDPERTGRMHQAFGHGIHSCLGSWLARQETNIALTVLAENVARIELDPTSPAMPLIGGSFNEFGFVSLPAHLEPFAQSR